MFRLLGLVLPLCLDTFAIAAALGMRGLTRRQRIQFGLLFTAFEGGMPLVGLLIGSVLGGVLGRVADYIAIAALVGLGVYMLVADDEKEEERVQRLVSTTGLAVIGLGLSISLDELAIGFTLGLVHVSVAAALILIALQAFLVSQLGFSLGRHVGERLREGAERLAGVILIALAAVLLVSKFVHLPI